MRLTLRRFRIRSLAAVGGLAIVVTACIASSEPSKSGDGY